MNIEDLSLYTTEQLIEEIFKRTTFVGIIIKSNKELKENYTPVNSWNILVKGISKEDTEILLNIISSNLNSKE